VLPDIVAVVFAAKKEREWKIAKVADFATTSRDYAKGATTTATTTGTVSPGARVALYLPSAPRRAARVCQEGARDAAEDFALVRKRKKELER